MRRPRGFDYDPGDWVELQVRPAAARRTHLLPVVLADRAVPHGHVPCEGNSEVKRLLATAEPGTDLRITSYGNDYGFTLNENRASMLVAGGVGVAPFRSMVKDMVDTGSRNEVDLVYLNKGSDFLFKDELVVWRKALPGLTLHLINTEGVDRKARERLLRETLRTDDLRVFLAGPRAMVENTRSFLTREGIAPHLIRIDEFGGY